MTVIPGDVGSNADLSKPSLQPFWGPLTLDKDQRDRG